MALDGDINLNNINVIKKAKKAYIYIQPNHFPHPWGMHPNFISHCDDRVISILNNMDNVYLWSWCDDFKKYHHKWKGAHTIPLAFDSISYTPQEDTNFQYDCCYIGGWADNGFNEKRKIMLKYFSSFKDSGLKCGFFINKGLSHEQENKILSNSLVSLNIHDAYQQSLGLDTNERTFKSLGLCGLMVSDRIDQVERLFPKLKLAENPEQMVNLVKEYLSSKKSELLSLKKYYRNEIIKNHTYIERVRKMIEYEK